MAGTLYVTAKCLLLGVEVDPDKNRVAVMLDGRQRPLILAVPEPIVTGAVIERAGREA